MTTQVSFHECCHSMGLVPAASSNYNDHNDCRIGEHYMDSGQWRNPEVSAFHSLYEHLPPRSRLEYNFHAMMIDAMNTLQHPPPGAVSLRGPMGEAIRLTTRNRLMRADYRLAVDAFRDRLDSWA